MGGAYDLRRATLWALASKEQMQTTLWGNDWCVIEGDGQEVLVGGGEAAEELYVSRCTLWQAQRGNRLDMRGLIQSI